MSNFFILLYRFFHRNKILFIIFNFILLSFIFFFASRIKPEENISQAGGDNSSKYSFEYVVQHFKFSEKLIIHFQQADTSLEAAPGMLTAAADSFTRNLTRNFDRSYIASISGRVQDTLLSFYFTFFHDHLPVYLDSADLSRIDSLLTPGSIDNSLRNGYKMLISPASFALKNMLKDDPLGIISPVLNKVKSLNVSDNFILENGFIMTSDRKHLLIFVTSANPVNETSRNSKLVKGIDAFLKNIAAKSNGKIKAGYFGSTAVATGNADRLKKDIFLTLTIAIIFIFLFIGWYFQSFRVPILSFLPALFGGGCALAILYLVKGTVSTIALGVGSVILGLIVDYALYIINHFRKKGDIETVLKDLSLTVFLCFLTSAGAFLCLIFLRSGVLHDLGWFATLSVAGAAFFALVILPHLLGKKDLAGDYQPRKTIIDKFISIPFEKKYWLISGFIVMGILSFFTMKNAGFEQDMMSMNYQSGDLRQSEKELDKISNVSLKNVYLVSTGKDLDEALRNHEKVEVTFQSLKNKNFSIQSSGIGTLLPSDSVQKSRILKWNEFWTGKKKEELKKNLQSIGIKYKFRLNAFNSFFQLLDKSFTPLDESAKHTIKTAFLDDWINETPGPAMVTSVVKVKQKDKKEVYHEFSRIPGLIVFDKQLITNRFVENVKHDFDLLVKYSMLFVTLLLILSFGRIELGLTAALPMFFSWLITLGFMGITGTRFNIFNIIISSFIFGLGVDYSILMMRGLLQQFKYGTVEIDTYKRAILLSSITTLIGVGALFFAVHPALNSIALIAIVGIVSVVMITYIFQPILINWFLMNRLRKKRHPVTARIIVKTLVTWGNIVLIAIIMVLISPMLFNLLPLPKKKKQYLFHYIFSRLCEGYIRFTFPTSHQIYNPHEENFQKPAIIISNHQSLIETPLFLRFYPKILILTGTWVYKSPLFGPIARLADYFNADFGVDSLLEKLRVKISEGYSILIFPEAHRSDDQHIQRFHRGAFYLSEKLELDILSVLVFGTGDFLPRNTFYGRPNTLRMRIFPRIRFDDPAFGTGVSERTRMFRRFFIEKFNDFRVSEGNSKYYRRKLILNYVFKGPILEWYLKTKLKLENNYSIYNELLPRKGEIMDIGCGYGFISYMLAMTSEDRIITGIDHDPEKIAVADHCFCKNERMHFISADITKVNIEKKDAFILSDVLHYLPENEQEGLLQRCIENLRENGVILIRDADTGIKRRHKGTRLTEFFSTRSGFNMTMNVDKKLHFTSREMIENIVSRNDLQLEIIDPEKLTSNLFYIIRFAGKSADKV
ncbi:MAG: methyltransferase domain-containing protein [Bacteroidetes bacterium]|nr:methyltransferase domain-containing protein [Bacteroidota bacterium]